MKIVKLKGGLGNQMFQYGFAKLLEGNTDEEVKLDLTYFDGITGDTVRMPRITNFNLSLPIATRDEINDICRISHEGNPLSTVYKFKLLAEMIINQKYYFEKTRAYVNPELILSYSYFDGYWQSWKIISKVWDTLKKEFIVGDYLSAKTKLIMNNVGNQNSVFIGVRRGDYSNNKSHFGSFTQEYYDQAVEYILQRVENPVFYIFSNDINWVRSNMNFQKWNAIFREENDIVNDYEELMIMASCKHAIIVNSTFNWWGAKLNKSNKKIVIAPKNWFFDKKKIDIVPPNWVQI